MFHHFILDIQNLQVNFEGLSGPIEFDDNGFRKNIVLDILAMEKKTEPMKASNTSMHTNFLKSV